MSIFEKMAEAIVKLDGDECKRLSNEVIKKGIDPIVAIQDGFAKGMMTVGNNYENGEIYLPDLMIAAEAMEDVVKVLEPFIASSGRSHEIKKGKVVLATIQGDVHEIGKNIVRIIMSNSGFDVIDLGRDVNVYRIIEEAQKIKADIIGVSALMTSTMGYMVVLIDELSNLGIRHDFKVMVGGAPVTQEWAKKIGADGYANDAMAAVEVARDLLKK